MAEKNIWNLYENDKQLVPLEFSNKKNQEDIVNETLKKIKENHKIIFIKGGCGTGKSAIALNIAKELGRASIVVPAKALQEQYEEDYMNKKYILKDGKKLNIKVIKGRSNFNCQFLKEGHTSKEETNLTLKDFEDDEEIESSINIYPSYNDDSCDNFLLPCKIEIKERNAKKIKEYLQKNKKVNQYLDMKEVRRMSIAPLCHYWCPMIPSVIDLKTLEGAQKIIYKGLENTSYTIYRRKKGCGYYDQYLSYADADVIIFNSMKYKLETAMNRKPATDIEIIDECDEFLDSFSEQERLNLVRLNFSLSTLFTENENTQKAINDLIKITSQLIQNKAIEKQAIDGIILPLKDTKILDLLKIFIDADVMNSVECDEENYCFHCEKVAKLFEGFFDETYLLFKKEERGLTANLITTNLAKRFEALLKKNKLIVLMSGTLHSEDVMKNIFGLTDFQIVEAETKMPGKITPVRTGRELNCKYENFKKGNTTRKQYLEALIKCIQMAPKPILVHIISFSDLPTEKEAKEFGLNIMTREQLSKIQKTEKFEKVVRKFKEGEIDILYSTVCKRGVDFPGNICNSIILTKYPYPDVGSLFWKVLRKTNPNQYNSFYLDKARREFLQRIYRGLRSKDDHIYLLSPDIRVFENLRQMK
jgi:Rad3-related DNA helicase